MSKVALALLLLVGCSPVDSDEVVEAGGGDLYDIAEQYCKDHPELPCGHVWDCGNTNIPEQPDTVEVCVLNSLPLELVEDYYGGGCAPANHPRYNGHPLCWWCCGAGCGAGCNAYQGCFCPATEMP